MIQIKKEKIAELMFNIWKKSNDLKNPVMVGEYIEKELSKVENLDICGVSSSDDVRIKQISTDEFIVQKLTKKTHTKGYFLWKKTKIIDNWQRVNKYGNCINIGIQIHQKDSIVTYKSLKEAEDWVKNYKKYPIYHYC